MGEKGVQSIWYDPARGLVIVNANPNGDRTKLKQYCYFPEVLSEVVAWETLETPDSRPQAEPRHTVVAKKDTGKK